MDYADYDYKIGHQIFSWKYPIIWKRNLDYVRLLDDLAVLADEYLFCFVTWRLLMIPYSSGQSLSHKFLYTCVHDCFNLHWPTASRIVGARLVRICIPFFYPYRIVLFLVRCAYVCVYLFEGSIRPLTRRGSRWSFPAFCDVWFRWLCISVLLLIRMDKWPKSISVMITHMLMKCVNRAK